MTSVSTIKTALSYNLIVAFCAVMAIAVFHQSMDFSYLIDATSAGWEHIFSTVSSWFSDRFGNFFGQLGALVVTPSEFKAELAPAVK